MRSIETARQKTGYKIFVNSVIGNICADGTNQTAKGSPHWLGNGAEKTPNAPDIIMSARKRNDSSRRFLVENAISKRPADSSGARSSIPTAPEARSDAENPGY